MGSIVRESTSLSILTRTDIQKLLKQLNITGVEFSSMLGRSKNFVTDMNRFGVPLYVEIILSMAVAWKEQGGDPKTFLKQYDKSSVTLDKEKQKE
jgi:hypothetical protein